MSAQGMTMTLGPDSQMRMVIDLRDDFTYTETTTQDGDAEDYEGTWTWSGDSGTLETEGVILTSETTGEVAGRRKTCITQISANTLVFIAWFLYLNEITHPGKCFGETPTNAENASCQKNESKTRPPETNSAGSSTAPNIPMP